MKAMAITRRCDLSSEEQPLTMLDLPVPQPGANELLVRVSACAVCHTEIDEIEGRTAPATLPMIPGHQIIGRVEKTGDRVSRFHIGERVGIAWINKACGQCSFCLSERENLCSEFVATGRDALGGYAEYTLVAENFAFAIPPELADVQAAPLLCAGAVGYRALRLTRLQDGETIALVGFGASAHLVIQVLRFHFPKSRILVFARDPQEREFALSLGAYWSGDIATEPPQKAQAAIDTTPVWTPLLPALANLERGGRLVINAIRKENVDRGVLANLDYPAHLWLEKEIHTVANVTRRDVAEFLAVAAAAGINSQIQEYPLAEANRALLEIKKGNIRGAKVLRLN